MLDRSKLEGKIYMARNYAYVYGKGRNDAWVYPIVRNEETGEESLGEPLHIYVRDERVGAVQFPIGMFTSIKTIQGVEPEELRGNPQRVIQAVREGRFS